MQPDDLPEEGGYGIAGTRGNWLVLKQPPGGCYEEQDMYDSLKAALKAQGWNCRTTPPWKIDDTSEPGHIFCERREPPRLRGELLPADKAPPQGDFSRPRDNRVLANIEWLDDPEDAIDYDAQIDSGGHTVSESLASRSKRVRDRQTNRGSGEPRLTTATAVTAPNGGAVPTAKNPGSRLRAYPKTRFSKLAASQITESSPARPNGFGIGP